MRRELCPCEKLREGEHGVCHPAEFTAREVDVFLSIIFRVDFVEDLPRDVELDPLTDHFQLVSVLVLEVCRLLEVLWVVLTEMDVKVLLGLLHLHVKDELLAEQGLVNHSLGLSSRDKIILVRHS